MPPAKALDKKRLWRQIDREERAKARAKLLELRTQLRETKSRRKQALLDAKERCRAERLAARERARAIRIRVLEELREAMRAERVAAIAGIEASDGRRGTFVGVVPVARRPQIDHGLFPGG